MNGILKKQYFLTLLLFASSFSPHYLQAQGVSEAEVATQSIATTTVASPKATPTSISEKPAATKNNATLTNKSSEKQKDDKKSQAKAAEHKKTEEAKDKKLAKGIHFDDTVDVIKDYERNYIDPKHFETKGISALNGGSFGDSINPLTGELSFRVTDISLPGNSQLPVEITRRLDNLHQDINSRGKIPAPSIGSFTLEVPHLTTRVFNPYITAKKLGWHDNRCDQLELPGFTTTLFIEGDGYNTSSYTTDVHHYSHEFFEGVTLNAPGSWGEQLMTPSDAINYGTSPKYVTKSNWKFTCITAQDGGQGFQGVAPNGNVYEFDLLHYRKLQPHVSSYNQYSQADQEGLNSPVYQAVLFATKVTDIHGNWVRYDYNDGNLTLIKSNDDRQIYLSYQDSDVVEVTAHGKTWTYDGDTVSLPSDGTEEKKWTYKLSSAGKLNSGYSYDNGTVTAKPCTSSNIPEYIAKVTHPSGMTATFVQRKEGTYSPFGKVEDSVLRTTTSAITHHRLHDRYHALASHYCEGLLPANFQDPQNFSSAKYSIPIGKKIVSGPGLDTMTWYYGYEEGESIPVTEGLKVVKDNTAQTSIIPEANRVQRFTNDLPTTTTRRSIIDPDGNLTQLHINRQHNALYGKVEKIESFRRYSNAVYSDDINHGFSGFSKQKTVNNVWGVSTRLGTHWLKNHHENPLQWLRPNINVDTSQFKAMLFQTSIQDDGGLYNTLYFYDDNPGSPTYTYQLPRRIEKYSNIPVSDISKKYIKEYSYKHFTAPWVIGLVEEISVGNPTKIETVLKNTFHYNSPLVYKVNRFGKLTQTNDYHWTGQLKKITYNVTPSRSITYNDYYRGIAQKIEMPATSDNSIAYLHKAVDDFGQVTKVTDFTSLSNIASVQENCINYDYDEAFRLKLIDPCNHGDVNHSEWASTDIQYVKGTLADNYALKKTTKRGNFREEVLYDAMQRPTLSKTWDSSATTPPVYVSTDYDANNRVTFQSRPSHNQYSSNGIHTSYDGIGRIMKVKDTESSEYTEYLYTGWNTVTKTNEKGHLTQTSYLGFGSPEKKTPFEIGAYDNEGNELSYILFSHFTHLLQPQRISEIEFYDVDNPDLAILTEYRSYNGPNLCKTSRKDVGTKWHGYNNVGDNIWSELGGSFTSQLGCKAESLVNSANKVSYEYDTRGNLKRAVYGDSTPSKEIDYNQNNQVTTFEFGQVTHEFEYIDGVIDEEKVNVDGRKFTLSYLYDIHKNLKKITYPSGEHVVTQYNAFGQATDVLNFASNATYHPNGALKEHYYGNGTFYEVKQNSKGLPESQKETQQILGTIVDQAFAYDDRNNLETLTDNVAPEHNLSLRYDGLDRLSYIDNSFNGSGYIRYYRMGNIKEKKIGSQVIDYTYNTSNQLDHVAGSYARTYRYDTHGNVVFDGKFTFDYNLAGQMTRAFNNSLTNNYLYDGNGKRVKIASNQAATSYSMYGQNGKLMYRYADGKHIDYVHLGGKLIARQETSYADSTTSPQPSSLERMHYKPFGETIEAPKDDAGYTGHKFDTDLGLSYMQARYYDPVIGRFYSNDPVGVTGHDSIIHGFNRYAYANNNPYKYTDPNGESASAAATGQLGHELDKQINHVKSKMTPEEFKQAEVDAAIIVASVIPIGRATVAIGKATIKTSAKIADKFSSMTPKEKLDTVTTVVDGAMELLNAAMGNIDLGRNTNVNDKLDGGSLSGSKTISTVLDEAEQKKFKPKIPFKLKIR